MPSTISSPRFLPTLPVVRFITSSITWKPFPICAAISPIFVASSTEQPPAIHPIFAAREAKVPVLHFTMLSYSSAVGNTEGLRCQ